MRNGDNVVRYATEMYTRASGLPDLASVIRDVEKKREKTTPAARSTISGKDMPCLCCGRSDVDVYYTVQSVLSASFGDYMALKEQSSSHVCPHCTWVIKVEKLLNASGAVVWETRDGDGVVRYERKILRGKDKAKEAKEANIPGDPTIGKEEFARYMLEPPGDYFVIALNRSGIHAGKGTHFLPGSVVNNSKSKCKSKCKSKYFLSMSRSKKEDVLIDLGFFQKFLTIRDQVAVPTGKSKKKPDVRFGKLKGVEDFLNANIVSPPKSTASDGNGTEKDISKDPWDRLPDQLSHLLPFRPLWNEIMNNKLAMMLLYDYIR